MSSWANWWPAMVRDAVKDARHEKIWLQLAAYHASTRTNEEPGDVTLSEYDFLNTKAVAYVFWKSRFTDHTVCFIGKHELAEQYGWEVAL